MEQEHQNLLNAIEKEIGKKKAVFYFNQYIAGPASVGFIYYGITASKTLFLIVGIFGCFMTLIDQCLVIKKQLEVYNQCLDKVKDGKIVTFKQFERYIEQEKKKLEEE